MSKSRAKAESIANTGRDVSSSWSRFLPHAICAGLVILTVAVYYPVYWHEWLVYDDDSYVTRNPIVRQGLTWVDEAAQQLTEVVRIEPKNPRLHFNLGSILTDQGDYVAATDHYRTALQFNPDNAADYPAVAADIWQNLALALSAAGDEGEAAVCRENAARLKGGR